MKAYAHGIGKLHDSLLESTSSTKSLIAQDDALSRLNSLINGYS